MRRDNHLIKQLKIFVTNPKPQIELKQGYYSVQAGLLGLTTKVPRPASASLGCDSRALNTLGQHSDTELRPQPSGVPIQSNALGVRGLGLCGLDH